MIDISNEEFKYYIESRNNTLSIEEYIYITSFINIISYVRYNHDLNIFEISTYDNNTYKVFIKENDKIKKRVN